MDSLLTSAASGMRARLETLDVLANNLANAATAGYKSDQEWYRQYVAPESLDGGQDNLPGVTKLPSVDSHWTDYGQGVLADTGNATDLALSGKGFFVVRGSNGTLLTRNGSLELSKTGELQTKDGYPVLGQNGQSIKLDPQYSFDVAADGGIFQNGQQVASLKLADTDQLSSLRKQGGTYFAFDEGSIALKASSAAVHQGKIEQSNVPNAESAVKLINVMRQFEMLQRAITLGNQMNQQAVQEVARVTP